MSTYFSKVIKAGERLREFNFRQLKQEGEMRYHVDVPDDKGNRIIFQMYQDKEGQWKTDHAVVPAWVQTSEDALSHSISEQLDQLQLGRKKA